MAIVSGTYFGDESSFRKERRGVFLDEYPGFEIEPERKTQELVRGPRVAVDTAVLASPVRVYTGVETDVGAVVVRDYGPRRVLIKNGLRGYAFRYLLFGRLELDLLEPVGRVLSRAPALDTRCLRAQSPIPLVWEIANLRYMQKV